MSRLSLQDAKKFISEPRIKVYAEAIGSEEKTLELYQWAVELEGAFHATLSFAEIALRNSIDQQLQIWNSQHFAEDWTTKDNTREEIKKILGKSVGTARSHAAKELKFKNSGADIQPTHDDILAQLTFGNLSYIFIDPLGVDDPSRKSYRDVLWNECLKHAFPDTGKPVGKRICELDDGRLKVGRALEHLRQLRNRIAHHDNLLNVDVRREIHNINSILSKLHPDLPGFAMYKSQLRRLRQEDPRRAGNNE